MRRLLTIADDALLERLHVLVGSHRRVTADIIAHLSEVDVRRLHVNKGFSSLFGYCVERLGFSEDEACRRIEAARLARKFPEIFSHLEGGSVSLTVLGLLKQHLTAENHRELLAGVSGSSVRQAKEWLAAQFPQPDVPSNIRKLPERSALQVVSRRPASAEASSAEFASSAPFLGTTTAESGTAAPASGGAGLGTVAPAFGGAVPPASGIAGLDAAGPASGGAMPPASGIGGLAVAPPALTRATIEPLSRDCFLVKFTASRTMREKLALACDLLRHANPSGDLSVVFERAVDLLVAQLEKTKQGRRKRPQRKQRTRNGAPVGDEGRSPNEQDAGRLHDGAAVRPEEVAATGCLRHEDVAATSRPSRAPITRATRREVVERDGWRCSFVAEDGRRCDTRAFVEFDHETPRGLGGSSLAGNLRLLCRAHNRLAAERIYGKAYISQAIGKARATRGAGTR